VPEYVFESMAKMKNNLVGTRTYDRREGASRAARSKQVVGVGWKKLAVICVYDRRDVSRAAQSQPVVGVGCNAANTVQIEYRATGKWRLEKNNRESKPEMRCFWFAL
jgi:hypothetical protein